MQELLLKDLPDLSQARRYSRRPSLNGAPSSNGSCAGKAGNVAVSGNTSNDILHMCPRVNGVRERPRVMVKGLSAAWEKEEASYIICSYVLHMNTS